ncbi:MAG: hypothetical protein Q8P69_01405 [bacterium]|nr:hypothetical protein [bacterium]
MSKNNKTTLEKLEKLVNVVAINVAEIKAEMATKDDIAAIRFEMATKEDLSTGLDNLERRLGVKIDRVDEKVDLLEEVDIRGMQGRISALEDAKKLKQKHV